MIIQTASHMGLCFGVQDAVDMAIASAKEGKLHILGPCLLYTSDAADE